MRKHKINSILFTLPDDDLAELFLNRLSKYNHFKDEFNFEVQYISSNKTRVDSFVNHRQLVVSFNIDFGFFASKSKFKELTIVSPRSNDEYLNYFEKANLLGFQRHLLSKAVLNGVDLNTKDNLSIGLIRSQPNLVEPVFRKSDMISFDVNSIKNGENLNVVGDFPTGFTAEEFIQLVKYAGYSDSLKLINFNYKLNGNPNQLAELMAASIWYFLESLHVTSHEEEFEENLVHFEETDDYVNFQKSLITQKCWVHFEGKERKIACTVEEYEMAIGQGKISERIIKELYES